MQHTDEILYLLRKRIDKYRDLLPQDVVIMNDLFAQMLIGNFLEYKREGLAKFILDAELIDYAKGKKIQRGRPWSKCKALY